MRGKRWTAGVLVGSLLIGQPIVEDIEDLEKARLFSCEPADQWIKFDNGDDFLISSSI